MRYLLFLFMLTLINFAHASDTWTSFRGTNNDGWSNASQVPINWSEEENIKWKTAIHDFGWSSPVILGDQIWITTATEDGKKMYAVCISLKSRKILRDIPIKNTTF